MSATDPSLTVESRHRSILTSSINARADDTTLDSLLLSDHDDAISHALTGRNAILPSLHFRDKRLEHVFKHDYFAKYTRAVRASFVVGVCLWALFAINDIIKDHQGLRKNIGATLGMRFGACCCALIALKMSYTAYWTPARMTLITALIIVLFGGTQTLNGVIEGDTTDPTYSVAMVLISSTSSAFFRLPCFASIAVNFALYAFFVIMSSSTSSYADTVYFITTCLWLLVGIIIFSIHAYDREWGIRSGFLAARRLEYEEHRSQRVLLKMLPSSVIAQLRSGAEFTHERHSNISILFSHICDFDEHTSHMTPSEIISLLNEIFSRFDIITDEYSVYKVETIGDVYLISAGVPEPRQDHANVLAHVAISMMAAIAKFLYPSNEKVEMRIGINSGPTIAGIVGMKYPRFRLMGDTVNTASRMSTTCKAGDIQLSLSAFNQLNADEFVVQYRGEIPVKGKGLMKTYLVKGRVKEPDLASMKRSTLNKLGSLPTASASSTPQMAVKQLVAPSPQSLSPSPPAASIELAQPAPLAPAASAASSPAVTAPQSSAAKALTVQVGDSSMQPNDTAPTGPEWASPLSRPSPVSKRATAVHLPGHKSRTSSFVGTLDTNAQTSPQSPDDGAIVPLANPPAATDNNNNSNNLIAPAKPSADAPSQSPSPPTISTAATAADIVVLPNTPVPHDPEPVPGAEVKPSGQQYENQIIQLSSVAQQPVKQGKSEKDIMKISAKDVQVEALFNVPNFETLLNPKNPLDLTFQSQFTHLEKQFQQEFFDHFNVSNRRGVVSFIIAMLLLGVYETLFHLPSTSSESYIMTVTWSLRFIALVIGIMFYLFTHTKYWSSLVQQPILLTVWGIMGLCMITIFALFHTYQQVYGVTCVLLLLTMSSTFVGMQFLYVAIVTVFFIGWFVGAAIIVDDTFPLVVFFLLASNALAVFGSHSSEYYLRLDFIRHLKLRNEEERTRHFLNNMLPRTVIQEIKLDRSFIAHEFKSASILFSDIVGFTSIAASISPEDVVAILNLMFSVFDALSAKHNVYKVETIGDAYLACTGVVNRRANCAEDLVKFAMDLQLSTNYMHTPDNRPIVIRIGIHSGSVVAGVVGKKMPRYHLFGETVTIAEEMEQNGVPGAVAISASTYELVQNVFECEKLEPITLHVQPLKNILPPAPGAAATTAAAAAAAPAHESNKMDRYKVVSYLGPLVQPNKFHLPRGSSVCMLDHVHTPQCLKVEDVAMLDGVEAEPVQQDIKDEDEKPPPPFVRLILGKVHYKNWMAWKERQARRASRSSPASPRSLASQPYPQPTNVAPLVLPPTHEADEESTHLPTASKKQPSVLYSPSRPVNTTS